MHALALKSYLEIYTQMNGLLPQLMEPLALPRQNRRVSNVLESRCVHAGCSPTVLIKLPPYSLPAKDGRTHACSEQTCNGLIMPVVLADTDALRIRALAVSLTYYSAGTRAAPAFCAGA